MSLMKTGRFWKTPTTRSDKLLGSIDDHPRFDSEQSVIASETAGGKDDVGSEKRLLNFEWTRAVGLKPLRIEVDSYRPWLAADDIGTRYIGQCGQALDHLFSDSPQGVAVVGGAGRAPG